MSAGSSPTASASASCMRTAAFPVGAASATRGGDGSVRHSIPSSRARVWVLPVPGPPATRSTPVSAGTTCCRRLVEVGIVAQQLRAGCGEGSGGNRCRRTAEARHQLGGHHRLLLPVPLEVQPLAHQAKRPVAAAVSTDRDQGAGGDRNQPRVRFGQEFGRDPDALLVGVEPHLVTRRQLETGGSGPERTDGKRQRQQHPLVGLAEQVRHLLGDVHVAPGQCAGRVHVEEQAGGEAGREVAHRCPRPASRSDSSVTRPAGGNQLKTPLPSPVPGPPMPRTNR